ncbi:HD domain-containing protein [Flintibacter faecis]|uniref:HD domain-containing protein n=1 Tax=Flintibacter faecis TaxID=2763047 RepID=A0A8J6M5C3_9FIRM|nr:HD domain-containing protein [Flintibacter faecis]MBC5716791.1 HD domain-containing protein [Flintibacter faecis]
MERVNAICRHQLWRDSVREIARLERDRQFCRHDLVHFLDVARLAYIENLERGLGIDKELIYAAALLHDIGRHLQYTQNIPHDRASAQLAEVILADCGFSQAERAAVEDAILQHRGRQDRQREGLAGLLYEADKASRACLFCPAEPECNWSPEKKNMTIKK